VPVASIPPAAPLIVLGAPLSGTDRVASLLHGDELLLGNDSNRFGESHFFLDQDRWLFRCAHAEWDVTEPMGWTFEDEALSAALADELRARCEGKGIKGFLGWKTGLRTRSLLTYVEPWGWADTLTSFTLPLWLRVFPKARVVHVVRNGVDVALDLSARERERHTQLKSRARSVRCLDPERAFEVWSAYVAAASAAAERHPADRVLRLRCEDLTRDPAATLESLTTFAGLELPDERRAELIAGLEGLPVDAFQASEQGRALYRRLCGHALMKAHQYDGVKAAS
jgi:Sulfotransferase family